MITILELIRKFEQLLRFYAVGIINTLFGYSLFFLLIATGLNIYVAQLIGHLIGMAFNYIMYRRHVFTGISPSMTRFVAAYVVNYLLGLSLIFLFSQFVSSRYAIAGLAAVTGSLINFAVLKQFVFTGRQIAP